ncbi:P-type conjugative transfer protein TrbJ [Pseudaminobacter salicylatoxidans]|uniref:P-type conjugative transfer protein TrbJ n=1 Tax=Pseudaminobacter salicylatoxidans TaxID=93369 RepID=A0A316BLQ7_PSESE|nr:P-type conjugative transfer protein TrbJ [Pseudaminobacter salicylatoxidans]PWJ74149.1 P-type conjugative transfer protein TrbJ [Pseudaminobacter salicylatoxidans]
MLTNSLLRSTVAGVLLALSISGSAHAGAATGGATEWTQLLNNVQLLEQSGQGVTQINNQVTQITNQMTQIQNQLDQYRTMLQNLEKLPDNIWGQAQQDLNQLRNLVQQGDGIAFSMGGLDDVLKQRFPSFEEFASGVKGGENYSDQYQSWSQTNRDTIGGTLAQAGLTAQQFDSEQSTMRELQSQSQSAVGQMQALQVGHSIASQQVEQMQKLRGLVAQQSTMMGAWYQSEQAAKDLAQNKREQFFNSTSPSTSGGQEMQPRW